MPVPIWQVDAFTSEAFRGNPAAVCLLDQPATPEWMQHIAAEMNLSETAFVVAHSRDGADNSGEGDFDLRWFTPTAEAELCGHATLSSAHVLLEEARVEPGTDIAFQTRSGVLTARGVAGKLALDFPAYRSEVIDAPAGLVDALGVEPQIVAENSLNAIVVLETEAAVRTLEPDIRALRVVDVEAIAVTAPSDDPVYDFVSRYFAPRWGIDEDPVTGSAHCALGPWWAARLGRDRLIGHQVSTRGGVVRTTVEGDRVILEGEAVTVWRGELAV